jgi:GH24 family phage-related lysozyme (muramidase)
MRMSTEGRANLHQREKLVMKFYDDGGRPGVGHCSYGFGTLAHRGPCTAEELKTEVTDEMVKTSFESRVREAEQAVERHIKVPLNQQQFDALVSFSYNTGARGARDVFKLINAGKMKEAADLIARMVYSTQTRKGKKVLVRMTGLVARREKESAPFRDLAGSSTGRAAR